MARIHVLSVLTCLAFASPGLGQNPCAPGPRFDHATFAGELGAGETFASSFGDGLTFKLVPTAAGWVVEVRDPSGVDQSLITPPIRPFDTNPRNLAGWHFRNAANTAPNEGDVNAPQHRRELSFGPAPASAEEEAPGRGVLTIEDFGLADLIAGQRARMVYLKFRVCLAWPARSARASREYTGLYRSGFEQSDFYTDDGDGPWWLSASGADWDRIQQLRIERPGRGSYIAARMTVRGHTEAFDDHGVLVGRRDTRLVVERILALEAVADEVFQARAMAKPTTPRKE